MGFIYDTAKKGMPTQPMRGNPSPDGRALWREVFGVNATSKEEGSRQQPVAGGSYGRSITGTDAAIKRLVEAMRSRAPGGWSDDRWEQTMRHFVGIQYVAIHRCGEQMAQAEFQVFVKDEFHPDGRRPVKKNDPPFPGYNVKPYELVEILEKPNNDDSFGDLMYRWNQQMDLTGSALTWMVPNQLGTPYELYSIPTCTAIPQPTVNPDFPHGYYRIQPVYPYGPFSSYPTPASAVGAPIPAEWMLRFCYPHPLLRYDGYSPLTALRSHIDQHESMDRSRWWQMKRTINPSAVLNFEDMEGSEPLPEPEIDRIKAEFEATFMGTENVGQLFVAAPGSRLEPWGGRPVDMDYPAGWEQLASFILGGGFGITKQAAGMIEDSSYSTLFATLKQLYWLTLEPKVNRIASKLTRHLAPFFGPDLIVVVRCKPINDHEITSQKISQGLQCRCITKNEVRKLLDLPVVQEPWGDEMAGVDPLADPLATGMPVEGVDANGQPVAAGGMGPDLPNPEGVMDALQGEGGEIKYNTDRPEHDRDEPMEVTRNRPRTGRIGRGSVGPEKSLGQKQTKSFYDRVMEVVTNGH